MTPTPTDAVVLPSLPVVAWMTEDGRVSSDETKQCMPRASKVNFNEPLVKLSDALAALSAQPQQVIPGWQLVPVEPTEAMRSAGAVSLSMWQGASPAVAIWHEMLACAPQPAAQQGKIQGDLAACDRGGVTQWRAIESAPKDGTNVLLYAPPQVFEGEPIPERLTHGYWSAPSDIPRIKYQDGFAPEEEWDEWEPYWASSDGGFTEENPPTHWMPLPAPPTGEGA